MKYKSKRGRKKLRIYGLERKKNSRNVTVKEKSGAQRAFNY